LEARTPFCLHFLIPGSSTHLCWLLFRRCFVEKWPSPPTSSFPEPSYKVLRCSLSPFANGGGNPASCSNICLICGVYFLSGVRHYGNCLCPGSPAPDCCLTSLLPLLIVAVSLLYLKPGPVTGNMPSLPSHWRWWPGLNCPLFSNIVVRFFIPFPSRHLSPR